jgi:hypothetical protein
MLSEDDELVAVNPAKQPIMLPEDDDVERDSSATSHVSDTSSEISNSEYLDALSDLSFETEEMDVEARLNDPGFCSPELLEKINQDPELRELIAEDLTSPPLHVPQEDFIPLGLKNGGNTCYRNASNQMILHSPLSKLLAQPRSERGDFLQLKKMKGETDDEHEKRVAKTAETIKKTLKVYQAFKNLAAAYVEQEKSIKSHQGIYQAEKIYAERETEYANTLIASGLMPDLTEESRYSQQDAAAYLGMLYSVLGVSFELQETYQTLPSVNTPQKTVRQNACPMVHLDLAANESLEGMIDGNFSVKENDDPKNIWRPDVGPSTAQFIRQEQILGEPQEMLTLWLGRKIWNKDFGMSQYLDNPINISSDVIDMSASYGKEPGSILYELTGFVAYTNFDFGGESGHYYSYIKKEDGWYLCSDTVISKVSAQDIAAAKTGAYLLTVKRLNPEA